MSIFSTCKSVNESVFTENSMILESVETLEEGVFKYTPSMIPVLAKNTAEGTKYLVEFDMLQKLAFHNNTGILEAYETIVNENSIDSDDLYVFVSESSADYIIESEINEYDSGKVNSINYQINVLSENGVNVIKVESLQEIAKMKFFKWEKLAAEHPEVSKVKDELIKLNKYATSDTEYIYRNESDFWTTVLKVLRVICAVESYIKLIAGPFGAFIPWLGALLDKVIIHAIDTSNAEKTAQKAEDAVAELKKIADKCEDNDKKQEILEKIEKINKSIEKLRTETDED